MEQQPPLPCVHCLDVHSCGEFMRFPMRCVHSGVGSCQFCRDAGKPCVKVPERLTHMALLLSQLLRLASQESSVDRCPVLRDNIRVVRRDFFQHLSINTNIERGQEAQAQLHNEDEESVTAPLQKAARVTIEEFEEVQLILRQILPSLNSLSSYFLETSDTLDDMSRRLTNAIVDNYLLYRHDG